MPKERDPKKTQDIYFIDGTLTGGVGDTDAKAEANRRELNTLIFALTNPLYLGIFSAASLSVEQLGFKRGTHRLTWDPRHEYPQLTTEDKPDEIDSSLSNHILVRNHMETKTKVRGKNSISINSFRLEADYQPRDKSDPSRLYNLDVTFADEQIAEIVFDLWNDDLSWEKFIPSLAGLKKFMSEAVKDWGDYIKSHKLDYVKFILGPNPSIEVGHFYSLTDGIYRKLSLLYVYDSYQNIFQRKKIGFKESRATEYGRKVSEQVTVDDFIENLTSAISLVPPARSPL